MGYVKLDEIIKELSKYADYVSKNEVNHTVSLLMSAQIVFVAGVGRSGFVGRGFANRLKHLGKEVYFVGDTTAAPIKEGDVLVICSGSGATDSLVAIAKKAKYIGAKVVTLTVFPKQTIGRLCDAVIQVPGASPKAAGGEAVRSKQPMGSLFEQMCWLVLDSIILVLMEELSQTSEDMYFRHGNLE